MTTPKIACVFCARLRPGRKERTCDAFPDGIPDEVLFGQNQHTEPIEGDSGLLFKPLPQWEDA